MKTKIYSRKNLIFLLKEWAEKNGKTLNKRLINADVTMPSEMPFRCVFGTWAKALKSAGFIPTKYIPVGARKGKKNKKGVKKIKDSHGYINIFNPSHPLSMKNGYVKEHRMLAYNNGLLKNSIHEVHHINGIKSDNRIKNLQVLTKENHTSITHKGIKKTNKNHPKRLFCKKNTRSKYQLCSYHYRNQLEKTDERK